VLKEKDAKHNTFSRSSVIPKELVGSRIYVHNGKNFGIKVGNKLLPLIITEDMVGHRLGEFVMTRTFKGHPEKKSQQVKDRSKKLGGKK
jgi:small subunit ribosomal protein S19